MPLKQRGKQVLAHHSMTFTLNGQCKFFAQIFNLNNAISTNKKESKLWKKWSLICQTSKLKKMKNFYNKFQQVAKICKEDS